MNAAQERPHRFPDATTSNLLRCVCGHQPPADPNHVKRAEQAFAHLDLYNPKRRPDR